MPALAYGAVLGDEVVPVPLLITKVSEPTVSTIAVMSEVFIVVFPS